MKYSPARLTVILCAVFLAVWSCSPTPVKPADIYFLPLDGYSTNAASQMAEHYRQRFKLAVSVLPARRLDKQAMDTERHQVIAEEVIEMMKANYQQLLTNPKAIIIGLTSRDMYIREYNWQFAFTFRKDGRYAVVSSARLDPGNLGEAADAELLSTRLRKMIIKDIGLLYFGLALSDNPHSVLFSRIEGVEELDAVGEDF